MAVFVDISDTLHLAYAPLNEKHNVLYNRARQIFNQRFIQKPWFNLSPFLDKAAVSPRRTNLENFVPDDFKGVQPLQSLCIVENYFKDRPLSMKEFKIGEFWDFLFSSDWEEGHSIRVLEGRLLEMLVSTLVRLNKTGEVVHHTTLAYAKNRRPRNTVYKHSTGTKKDEYLRSGEETLLLEFIYYGRAVNYEPDGSSVGYAGSSTTWPYASSFSEDIESSDTELQGEDAHTAPKIPDNSATAKPPPDKDTYSKFQQKRFRKRVLYTKGHAQNHTDSELSIGEQARPTMPKHRSEDILRQNAALRVRGEQGSLSIIHESVLSPKSKDIPRKETLSNFSSGSDYTQAPAAMVDLKKFLCSEKVPYLGEFDLDTDSDSSDNEAENFGQEYYLGDVKKPEFDTYEEMLRNRKHVLGYMRTHQRLELNKRKMPKKSMLPVLSELDIKKYLSDSEVKGKQQVDDKVPDLEEYIDMLKEHAEMLKECEKMERLKEIMEKQNIKRIPKKYRMIKLEDERFGDEVGGVTDSIPCKLHCYDQDPSWRNLRDRSKRNFLVEKLMAAGGKVTVKPKRKVKKEPKVERKLVIPLIYVTTISGITYLHPVSKQMIQKQWQEQAANMSERIIQKLEAQKLEEQKKKKSRTPSPAKEVKKDSEDVDTDKPMFPKAVPLVKGRESPDLISDEESDEFEDTDFDTAKLNKTYSIEKIKKLRREQRAKERAGKFNQVLQKYFRMQTVLKAFTPKPKPSRRLSLSPSKYSGYSAYHLAKPKKKKQTKLALPRLMGQQREGKKQDETTDEKITVGKLKHYRFLDASHRSKPTEEAKYEERHDAFPMEDFRLNTERALEEFVVRREIIVSDSSTKKSVSVTFTKKSVFTKSKFSCD